MGGRGRGRGKPMSLNIEALGFARGDALPTAILQPPPRFPVSHVIYASLHSHRNIHWDLA